MMIPNQLRLLRPQRIFNSSDYFRRFYSPILKSQNTSLAEASPYFEITDSAANRLQYLATKFPEKVLRVGVESGGCHGFQYKFELTPSTDKSPEDLLFIDDTRKSQVICDQTSWKFIKDSKLDYTRELIGSAFIIIDNPAAASGCGCGVSFDLKIE